MIINNNIRPIGNIGSKPSQNNQAVKQGGFEQIFQKKLQEQSVKLSKHAEQRLRERNITLNDSQIKKINDAVDKAEQKGIKETLVLMDNLALVVNVKNRIVVTAAETNQLKENVFTNIDGAVLI